MSQNQPFVPEHNVVTDSSLNPDYSTQFELIPAPSAWKSIPGFVRVAVWIWSLAVVIGTVVGAASAVAWVFALASIFSQ